MCSTSSFSKCSSSKRFIFLLLALNFSESDSDVFCVKSALVLGGVQVFCSYEVAENSCRRNRSWPDYFLFVGVEVDESRQGTRQLNSLPQEILKVDPPVRHKPNSSCFQQVARRWSALQREKLQKELSAATSEHVLHSCFLHQTPTRLLVLLMALTLFPARQFSSEAANKIRC